MISATIDSSVYIRALHLGGPAALLIGHARAGNIRIDISDPILNETVRVLRDKFGWSGDMLHDARGRLAKRFCLPGGHHQKELRLGRHRNERQGVRIPSISF